MEITVNQLSKALGLTIIGNGSDRLIAKPLTDSRSLTTPYDTLFFAITTSSNDGHRYIRDLERRGVRNFVINRNMLYQLIPRDDTNYLVSDEPVVDILQQSAAYIRSMVSCPVIAITGSRGKTVVKEMIASACSDWLITKSPRSWNSQIGVPLSVWRLEPDTRLAIFEAGISRPGEMERLEKIIRPSIGVFTGLTDEHARSFDNIEQKCREKAALFVHCSDIVYIPTSDIIKPILSEVCPGARLHEADEYGGIVRIVENLVGHPARPSKQSSPVSTRIDISEGGEGNIFAFDYFTNDLDGIETALDQVGRRVPQGSPLVAVLGDLQLYGTEPEVGYRRLEQLLTDHNVDGIVGVGEEISRYVHNFSDRFRISSVPSAADFIRRFNTYNFPHSALLIKGTPTEEFVQIKNWLEDTRHDTCLEVNLDALTHNFNYYRSLVKPGTGMIGMVKADAYGAGAVEVSRTLQSQGADYLAVAVVEEGLALRRGGIKMPIMVLNPIANNYTALFDKHLEPTIFSLIELDLLNSFVPDGDGEPYPIHIKLDTGMHRFGFNEKELPRLVEEIKKYPRLRVASIFSHLATADCTDMDDYTITQLNNFDRMSGYIIKRLGYPVKRHILNTAGIMRFPQYQYDMVRLGIGLYGISPIDDNDRNLRPVSRLTTCISALQERTAGETVGYARRGKITSRSVIATLPIGYADGLNRLLGNGRTSMMVNGVKCPTVGNICMDICMIDVTHANAICTDRVEIFGDSIPVTEVAKTLGTIPYEVLTWVAPRVKRLYFRE
ncbi:MAG: alanine racemase [Muribaculaceae bacterium]|nr:alanine racemase [Muribaculaceae bacterium]